MQLTTLIVLLAMLVVGCHASLWAALDGVLLAEISNHSFPGCVALVATQRSGVVYHAAHGGFTYGEAAPHSPPHTPMTTDTLFDLASLTKVLATTTATMVLFQHGLLDLYTPVMDILGPAFAANGKATIEIHHLLEHSAGFPPDPSPGFWQPTFGCPGSTAHSPPETFACQDQVYAAVLNQTLATPVGAVFVYSDLSMITMMYVIGTVVEKFGLVDRSSLLPACVAGCAASCAQCYYEAYVQAAVVRPAGMSDTGFLPDPRLWGRIAPTWNDTTAGAPGNLPYRNIVLQGQVSDQNAYALGGICGHAGLFSHTSAVNALLGRLLFASEKDPWINATTVKLFTTCVNETFSSRALGWDTNSYISNTYRGCGNFSNVTFTHTGYTGTEVCADPERGVLSILLTNRVYPNADDESEDKIHLARQRFHNAIVAILQTT